MISDADLKRWLEAYGKAWETKSPEAVTPLFSEDATYRQTPYEEPFRGRGEIADYWSNVTADQKDIRFGFETVAVKGDTGIALWSSKFRTISADAPVELNGVFILEFADSDHVRSLREWWHLR